jgi:hypothetical protein
LLSNAAAACAMEWWEGAVSGAAPSPAHAPGLSNFNLFSSDPVLKSFAGAFADPAAPTVLSEHGMLCGSEEFMQAAR